MYAVNHLFLKKNYKKLKFFSKKVNHFFIFFIIYFLNNLLIYTLKHTLVKFYKNTNNFSKPYNQIAIITFGPVFFFNQLG